MCRAYLRAASCFMQCLALQPSPVPHRVNQIVGAGGGDGVERGVCPDWIGSFPYCLHPQGRLCPQRPQSPCRQPELAQAHPCHSVEVSILKTVFTGRGAGNKRTPWLPGTHLGKGSTKLEAPAIGKNSGLHGAEPSMASLSTASVYLYHRKSESRVSPQTVGRGMHDQSSPSPPLVCQNHFRYPEAGEQVWVPCPQPQLTLTWHVVPRSPATLGLH